MSKKKEKEFRLVRGRVWVVPPKDVANQLAHGPAVARQKNVRCRISLASGPGHVWPIWLQGFLGLARAGSRTTAQRIRSFGVV